MTEWARLLLLTIRRWLPPDRCLVAVMDGEFAALELLHALRPSMVAITRLRLDARLFDPPSGYDKRGRPARMGIVFRALLSAAEQGRSDVAEHRRMWRVWRRFIDPERFVFIDETGAATNMVLRYGWAELPKVPPACKWNGSGGLRGIGLSRRERPVRAAFYSLPRSA